MACTAALMLASCSQEEFGGNDAANNEDLQAIKIGVTQKNIRNTRGTGTVGGVVNGDGADVEYANQWAGESFNLFMFKHGTLDLAQCRYERDGQDAFEGPVFDNQEFKAPNGHDGKDASDVSNYYATAANGDIRYYPTQGAYDFWAYRLDDCEAEPYAIDGNKLYINFTMDGSQDIMTAKAEPTADQIEAVGGEDFKERLYSAWTARKDVNPCLKFSHELTRLKFLIKGGNDLAVDAEKGIKVEKIQVRSKYTGRLIAAYTPDAEVTNNIEFSDGTELMTLKQRTGDANEPLVDLEAVAPTSTVDYDKVGEALLVAPQDEYELIITISQLLKLNDADEEPSKTFTEVKTVIKPQSSNTEGLTFEKGYSYNVKMNLFGLQEIKITTELAPWTSGKDIEFTPEEDEF